MAKYEPLASYLRRQRSAEVTLSFREIERIVSGILPKASRDERWWVSDDGEAAQPQQKALAGSGYTARPAFRAERVVFVRLAEPPQDF